MALLAGMGLEKLQLRFQYLALILIVLEGIGNAQHDFFIKEREGYKLEVETLTAQFTNFDDLIVINGGPSPQEIYLAHRKGWTVNNDQLNPMALKPYQEAGASFLIVNLRTYPDFTINLPSVAKGKDYAIFNLSEEIPVTQ
jgi:hypothetical protein